MITWSPTFVKIKGLEYAMRNVSSTKKLYNANNMKKKDPLGEINITTEKVGKSLNV